MHAFGGKELAGNTDIFGSHRQARTLAHGAGVVESGGRCDADTALGNLQIQGLVQTLAAVLNQVVFAGNTQISTAILHIGWHIGCTHHQQTDLGVAGAQDQFTRGFRVVQHLNTRCAQERQGFFKNPSFGQRQCDHGMNGEFT